MKVLVFGQTAQIARALARHCPADIDMAFLGRAEADLSDPQASAERIARAPLDLVINVAAWTDVDRAEDAEQAATVVNGEAPGAMARACAAKNVALMHISSDYIFDGAGDQPFTPDHPPAPLSAYGRSKLAGEEAVRASGARHLILRTSWVFSAHGKNFLTTMTRLGAERESLKVVAEQIGGPTPAAAIAEALFKAARAMVDGHRGGTYHFAGAPDTSWSDFARAIMEAAQLPCQIEDITTSEYPTPAQRPLNSRLDCSSFIRDFSMQRPDWRAALPEMLKELGALL